MKSKKKPASLPSPSGQNPGQGGKPEPKPAPSMKQDNKKPVPISIPGPKPKEPKEPKKPKGSKKPKGPKGPKDLKENQQPKGLPVSQKNPPAKPSKGISPGPLPPQNFTPQSENKPPGTNGQRKSLESLVSAMANLKAPNGSAGPKPKGKSGGGGSASSSSTSLTDQSKVFTPSSQGSSQDEESLNVHLGLLGRSPELDELNEIKSTPIFTEAVRKYALSLAGTNSEQPFSQYGLLAGDLSAATEEKTSDPRIFWNVSAPSSFFICGSQGSGKSHTLSCLLENALAPCNANVLPRPLTGIVFHYDTFISDSGGSPCEVAWLSSNPDIKVRVLCAPTNYWTIKVSAPPTYNMTSLGLLTGNQQMYRKFPNIKVEELRFNESDLNTKRMLDLMAVTAGGNLPLYLHVAQRILRDLRITQQQTNTGFNYTAFKRQLQLENLTDMQLAPLKQRLETLESFMVQDQAKAFNMFTPNPFNSNPNSKPKKSTLPKTPAGTSWTPAHGHLTIIDLSCPCVTPEMACSLFNICLSLFLEQDSTTVGRVVALDEAHKYMTDSQECAALTEALLATIRLQRHLGARVVISTQEPTISPKLLDLCSVTVVHRFTSPDWLNALRRHLAGVSAGGRLLERARRLNGDKEEGDGDGDGEEEGGGGGLRLGDADPALELFSRIVDLRVGEALVFAPSAIVGVKKRVPVGGGGGGSRLGDVKRLAHGVLKVRVRNRITADGGRSIMAA